MVRVEVRVLCRCDWVATTHWHRFLTTPSSRAFRGCNEEAARACAFPPTPSSRSTRRQCSVLQPKATQAPGKTCAQATRSRVPTGERRRTFTVARSGQRVRACRAVTCGDRSSSLRATRFVRELGAAQALASVGAPIPSAPSTTTGRVVISFTPVYLEQ